MILQAETIKSLNQRTPLDRYFHQRGQINFWVPVTRVYDTNTLWIESEPVRSELVCVHVKQTVTHTHTSTHTHTRTIHAHTKIQARAHKHARTHAHTHTHTHLRVITDAPPASAACSSQ